MATSSQIPLPGLTISPSSTPNLSSPLKPTAISFPHSYPPNPNFLKLHHRHHISPLRAHRHTPKTTPPRNKNFTRQRKMPDEKDQYQEDETSVITEKTESKPRKKDTPPLLGMKQKWVAEGVVTESLSNGMYRISLGDEHVIIGYVSGKIRTKSIRILPGDRVRVEMSSYDLTKGRIVYRL